MVARLLCGIGLWLLTASYAVQAQVGPSAQEGGSAIVPIPGQETTEHQDYSVVVLRALDKITARITEIELPIHAETKFGTLRITASYCRKRPPEETPESFAFLTVYDQKRNGNKDEIFSGWMAASNPALNPLEHPVYDIWVIDCKTVSPDVSSPNE